VIERTTGAPRDSNGARGRAIGVKDEEWKRKSDAFSDHHVTSYTALMGTLVRTFRKETNRMTI
jgi:hypothetical protein